MHSFPVLLALAVLNVAHSAPVPQADRKSVTRPNPRLRAGLQLPANARQTKRSLVRACVNANLGTATRHPPDGKCDSQWEYLQPDDPILALDSTSLIGRPLGTSVKASIDKHPGHGANVDATTPGVSLSPDGNSNHGHDGNDGPDDDDHPHTDHRDPDGDDDGRLFGGNGGTTFLGLGGPHADSHSDSSGGLNAGLTATLFGGGPPSPHASSSSQSSGDDSDHGDGSFNGGPVFAGHYPPSSPDHLHDDPSHGSSSHPGSSHPGSSHPSSSHPDSDSNPEDCDSDDGDESYSPKGGPGPAEPPHRPAQSPHPTSSPKPKGTSSPKYPPPPPAHQPPPPAHQPPPPAHQPPPPASKPSSPAPTLPPHHPHSHQPPTTPVPTWTEPEPDCRCKEQ